MTNEKCFRPLTGFMVLNSDGQYKIDVRNWSGFRPLTGFMVLNVNDVDRFTIMG